MAIGAKEAQIRALREKAWADRLKATSSNGPRRQTATQQAVLKELKEITGISSVTQSVTDCTASQVAERVRKWREANPELNRQRNRDYQRLRRAAEKANASA